MINIESALADFQLLEYKIVEFDLNNILINQEAPLNVSYKVDFNHSEVDTNSGYYVSILSFMINVEGKNENLESEKFTINMLISGAFSGKMDKMDIDTFEKMLDLNGVALLSQISRSYISSVTSLSGMPTINIPMINFNKLNK